MRIIRLFLASSEKLDYYRMAFGNLVRRLDDMYEKHGLRIKLFEWEDYDAAYNNRRKQDEYNDYARKSDMFIALFDNEANPFTIEEFDAALDEFRKKESPKIFVYCKDIPNEKKDSSLNEFQERLWKEMGYYWCRFDNRESLQFHFVMQLHLMVNSRMDDLKLDNGSITLNGLTIAKMDNLKFAAANDDYQKMGDELETLYDEIRKTRELLKNNPTDKDLEDDLQRELVKYNKLREIFAAHSQLLLDTAKRVAQAQGKRITDRMRRAMDALNEGDVHKANIILNDVEDDARRFLENKRQRNEITEQRRQNSLYSIEELKLKAFTLMSDTSIEYEERISRTEKIFIKADEIARECEYNKENYIKLLFDYVRFRYDFACSDDTIGIVEKLVQLCEETLGKEHPDTIKSYNYIGKVYLKLGDKVRAKEYLERANK